MKQKVMITLSTFSFLVVWGILIFQLLQQPSLVVGEVSGVKVSPSEKRQLEGWDLIVYDKLPTLEQPSFNQIKDLRKIDFSDIDSTDGIPIDIILKRLQID